MGGTTRFPSKPVSAPIITSVEEECTCCLLHPLGNESSAWLSSSPSSIETSYTYPLVSELIRMDLLDPPNVCFQVDSTSSKHIDSKKKWNAWVKSMACEKKFLRAWKQSGISDAVTVTSFATDIRIDQHTFEALLGFWCSATNTFIFPWGEASFTLEDSHVYTSLPLRGSDLDRKLTRKEEQLQNRLIVEAEKILVLHSEAQCIGLVNHDIWLEWFMNEKDIDDELKHLGFLSYWLSKNVFSLTTATQATIFGLAARLSLGDRIALAPALVANIYHDLNVITESLVSSQKNKNGTRVSYLKASARFGLLQCWVWERFEALRPKTYLSMFEKSTVRIARWSCSHRETEYHEAIEILQDERSFTWRPYSYRLRNWVEPEWYNMDCRVLAITEKDRSSYLYDFLALVSCTFLKGFSLENQICSESYRPNRFARQFGFDQGIPGTSEACRTVNYQNCCSVGVQVCIPAITRHGNPRRDYVKWWGTCTKIYRESLREYSVSNMAPEVGDNRVTENRAEEVKYKGALSYKETNNRGVKRKAEPINKYHPVIKREVCSNGAQEFSQTMPRTGSSYPFVKCVRGLSVVKDAGYNLVHKIGAKGDKDHNVINIDSDSEENALIPDVQPRGVGLEGRAEKDETALLEELEEFERLDFMAYEELSPESEESNKNLSSKCHDVHGIEAIERYPIFFRLIPQQPHYNGLLEGGKITEELKHRIFPGVWFMLVNLMKEVLSIDSQTNVAYFNRMFDKAQILERNGFDVRHLVARLKLVQKNQGLRNQNYDTHKGIRSLSKMINPKQETGT